MTADAWKATIRAKYGFGIRFVREGSTLTAYVKRVKVGTLNLETGVAS